ncbi:GTP pyrophosphokinase family protein [Saccharothrix saharensis]|uniref:GTP pyrophosphokinase n=1 Tax=Saccharothrix saharensis TaxID=571190 RepID=UPI00369A95D0
MDKRPSRDKPEEYHRSIQNLESYGNSIQSLLQSLLHSADINYHRITYRVKERASAERKIEANPERYGTFEALTDLLGVRIITYFNDEVDAVAKLLEDEFEVDEENSVDKRLSLEPDRFGYLSLHYILGLNEKRASLVEYRKYGGLQFEVQIRSILQHAWAEIEHDLGYKAKSVLPPKLRRRFSRIAGLLEIADDEFRSLRDEISKYEGVVEKKIALSLEGLAIDSTTLNAYIRQSDLVSTVDHDVVAGFNSGRVVMEHDTGIESTIATGLVALGFTDIAQIDATLASEKTDVIRFAHSFLSIHEHSHEVTTEDMFLPRGISLLYLLYFRIAPMESSEQENFIRNSVPIFSRSAKRLSRQLQAAWGSYSS